MNLRRAQCVAVLLVGLSGPAAWAQDTATSRPSGVSTQRVRRSSVEDRAIKPASGSGYEIWQTLGALAVVVGLIVVIRLALRRFSGVRPSAGASDAVQVLGRRALSSRHQAVLVRAGKRAVLVGIWPGGMVALGDVGDANEIADLSGNVAKPQAEETSAADTKDTDE